MWKNPKFLRLAAIALVVVLVLVFFDPIVEAIDIALKACLVIIGYAILNVLSDIRRYLKPPE